MSQGSVGCHPGDGVPFQAPPDEVKEHGVIAAFQCSLKLTGSGWPTGFAPTRTATVENSCSVRQCGDGAISWISCNNKLKDFILKNFKFFSEHLLIFAKFDKISHLHRYLPNPIVVVNPQKFIFDLERVRKFYNLTKDVAMQSSDLCAFESSCSFLPINSYIFPEFAKDNFIFIRFLICCNLNDSNDSW